MGKTVFELLTTSPELLQDVVIVSDFDESAVFNGKKYNSYREAYDALVSEFDEIKSDIKRIARMSVFASAAFLNDKPLHRADFMSMLTDEDVFDTFKEAEEAAFAKLKEVCDE